MPKRYEEIGDSEFDRYFYAASHAAVRGIGLALFKFRIEGAPYIPMDSAAIIGSNHIDGSDVVFVPTAVPNRHVSVIGRRGVMNPLFNRWGAVTIDRPEKGESLSREQLKIMQQPLLDGDLELIFTPGTRTPGLSPGRPKRGIAFLARTTEADVVPTVIKGSDNLFNQDVTVMFDEPIGHPESKKEEEEFLIYLMSTQRRMFNSIRNRTSYSDPPLAEL